jgi:hypothetical protein
LTAPNGAQTVQNLVTGYDGGFNSTFTAGNAGNWVILVEYSGNLFAKPSSYKANLAVASGSQQGTVTSQQAQTNSASTAQQGSQLQLSGYVYLVPIVVIVAVAAYLLQQHRRKKKVSS